MIIARLEKPRPGRVSGFSLIEMIVGVAALALLAALGGGAALRAIEAGKSAKCISNLRQIGVGLNAWLADNNNILPNWVAGRASLSDPGPAIDEELLPYLSGDKTVFACPADAKGIHKNTGTSYYWNSALNGRSVAGLDFLGLTDELSKIPVVADKEGFHKNQAQAANILHADGRATQGLTFTIGP